MGLCVYLVFLVLLLSVIRCTSHSEASNVHKHAASSQGMPWPAPQTMDQTAELIHINAENFKFYATQQKCDILDAAFVRYRSLTFASRPGNEKLYFTPKRQLRVNDILPLNVLAVTVKEPCQNKAFPTLSSDESCKL